MRFGPVDGSPLLRHVLILAMVGVTRYLSIFALHYARLNVYCQIVNSQLLRGVPGASLEKEDIYLYVNLSVLVVVITIT